MDLETTLNQSPIAKSTITHEQYSQAECQRDPFPLLQLSQMYETSKARLVAPILSSEDSHVRTLALRALGKAWQESEVDYSTRLSGLQKKLSQRLYSLKTCLPLELEAFDKSSEHLPKWGMIVGGRVYLPQALEPRINENDGSYWPTPVANDDKKSPEAHMAMKARMKGGPRYKPTSLNVMVKGVERGIWPTPTARDWKDNGKSPAELNRNSTTLATIAGGQLNPTWVEWLMGLPSEWTALNPLATAWFLSKSKRRSKN